MFQQLVFGVTTTHQIAQNRHFGNSNLNKKSMNLNQIELDGVHLCATKNGNPMVMVVLISELI